MAEDQVIQPGGDQDQVIQDQDQTKSLGWRAALPDEYKEHEFVKDAQKPGDFVKKAIETKTERDALKTKMEGAIFKPTDKSTPEEREAYRKAIGVPDKPEGYEFPQPEGQENDPTMVKWAQGVFHKYDLPKEAARGIGAEWNAFVTGMVEAEEKLAKDEMEANEKKFHEQFKSEDEYRAGYELSKRFWNKVTGTNFDEVYKEPEAWQVPVFMNFIFNVAKMTGEDTSPIGRSSGEAKKEGMTYDKSPPPPNI